MMAVQSIPVREKSKTIPPLTENTDLHKVAYQGSVLLLASVFGAWLNYLFGIFVAHLLGPDQFGLYVLGLTIFNILVLVVPLGINVGVIRFVSQQIGLGDRLMASSTIIQATCITALSGLIAGLGLVLAAKPLSLSLYKKPELTTVLWFFAAAVPLSCVGTVLVHSLQALQTVRYTVLIKYLWEPIGKFLLAALFFWVGFGLPGVLAAFVFTLVVSLGIAMRCACEIAGLGPGRMPPWRNENARALFAFCSPLAFSSFFGVIAPRSDMLILGYWVGTQALGIYGAAFQTSAILALVLGAFETSFAPVIGGILAREEWSRLKELYQAVSRWTFAVTFFIFLILVIFRLELLTIFGKEFAGGTACLIILSAGQVFNTATGSASAILLMSGHSRKVMWNTITLGIFLVIMNLLLIPHLGILGAAIAASVSLAITNMIRVIQVWVLYRIQPYGRSLAKPLLAGSFAGGATFIIKPFLGFAYYPLLAVLAGGFYCIFLFLLRLEDADRFLLGAILGKLKPPVNLF